MGTPTQRARHDGESGLALAAVIAATRDHRMTFPIDARVRRVSPNLSVPELYEVRARGRDGRFEATSAACDLSYNPRTGRERHRARMARPCPDARGPSPPRRARAAAAARR